MFGRWDWKPPACGHLQPGGNDEDADCREDRGDPVYGGLLLRAWSQSLVNLLTYGRTNAMRLDGLPSQKVDRAARNLREFVEVESLEGDCGIPLVFVSQPPENTPTGRMMREWNSRWLYVNVPDNGLDECSRVLFHLSHSSLSN